MKKYSNKSLVPSLERMMVVVSHVVGAGAGVSAAAAATATAMGSRRFFNTGSSSLMKGEPKKKKERHIERSSELQRERCDEISSTEVSLNQFPGLMVHGNVWPSETRRLLRFKPDTGYFEEEQDVSAAASNHLGHYELQVPHSHVCRGSAYGWLFLTDDNLNMKLLNPFSGAEIQLPPVKTLPPLEVEKSPFQMSQWFVTKAVFSANPSIEPRPVVLVIYGCLGGTSLAFCKPGDKGWTPLESSERSSFHMDAIYHKGHFYVLGYAGYVAAFDIGRRIDDDDHSVKTIVIADPPERRVQIRDCYLVVLDGELVRFEFTNVCFLYFRSDKSIEHLEREWKRDGDTTDEESDGDDGKKECVNLLRPRCDPRLTCCTTGIKIRRFDASEKQWVKVESLGDKAVFLGYNTSFAISASDYPAGVCIPDSVYFTGAGGRLSSIEAKAGQLSCIELPFFELGIYNVKDKIVKPLYPPKHYDSAFIKPASIWIVNSVSDDR